MRLQLDDAIHQASEVQRIGMKITLVVNRTGKNTAGNHLSHSGRKKLLQNNLLQVYVDILQ